MFRDGLGPLRISCRVHGDAEPRGYLLVVDNPFVAITDSSGHFHLQGVPAGELLLKTWSPGDAACSHPLHLSPGRSVDGLRLTYSPSAQN